MRQDTFPVGENPELSFEVNGHLKIEGWVRHDIEVTGADDRELKIDVQNSVGHILADCDATVGPTCDTANHECVGKTACGSDSDCPVCQVCAGAGPKSCTLPAAGPLGGCIAAGL